MTFHALHSIPPYSHHHCLVPFFQSTVIRSTTVFTSNMFALLARTTKLQSSGIAPMLTVSSPSVHCRADALLMSTSCLAMFLRILVSCPLTMPIVMWSESETSSSAMLFRLRSQSSSKRCSRVYSIRRGKRAYGGGREYALPAFDASSTSLSRVAPFRRGVSM